MAQQMNPRDVLADVIDGIAVEGTLRYALADGTTVDRTFEVHALAVAAN